jgi:hypothetical protein
MCSAFLQSFTALTTLLFQVECAFKMHLTGKLINVGQFSQDLVSNMIDDYMVNAEALTVRHWEWILSACRAGSEEVHI